MALFDWSEFWFIPRITTTILNPSVVEMQLSMPPIGELGTLKYMSQKTIAFWTMYIVVEEYHRRTKNPQKDLLITGCVRLTFADR